MLLSVFTLASYYLIVMLYKLKIINEIVESARI